METLKNHIIAVQNTMDTMDIRGVENMRKLVLCYDTLEYLAENLGATAGAEKNDHKEDAENGQR